MVIDSLFSALGNLLTIEHLLFMLGGVLLGISIGVLPGLGGIVGFSIMLPFLYGMDVTSALALLIGMVAVIPTSDTFTSVLMGIPGSSASQATVLDGYPLSQQGQAARALGAAFSSSLVGGLIGAIILTAFILFARPLILSLGSAELFALGVLGLSMVGVLSGDNFYKGMLACCVGLLIGSIGSAPATGEWRMSFGSYYLFDGVKLVIVGLGVFAVPEIIDLLVKNRRISKQSSLGTGWLAGIKDMWVHKWIVARCAPVGAMIGAIPGLGGSVVDWIAYGHIVQTAKDKSKFGKGDIRGVIAPESANNAKEGGGLVPTLLFGIPGSGSMAVFLGGLTILGIEAGPNLVTTDLDISYTIIWSLAIANVLGTGICILLSPYVARLTTIRYGFLAPFMIMVITFAAFQASRSIEDLILLLAVGAVGVLFKYFNWSRPALLIGFVLADTVETYLYQAVQFYSWSFIERPGVIIIICIVVVSVFFGNFMNRKRTTITGADVTDQNAADDMAHSEGQGVKRYSLFTGELALLMLVASFAIYAIIDSLNHELLGSIFPTSVAVIACLFATLLGIKLMRRKTQASVLSSPILEEDGSVNDYFARTWKNFLWFVALTVGTWLIGFLNTLFILFIAIMSNKTDAPLRKIVLISLIGVGALFTISQIMILHLPTGVIIDYFTR